MHLQNQIYNKIKGKMLMMKLIAIFNSIPLTLKKEKTQLL